MKTINPVYIQELKSLVKQSPYPRHMSMEIDHIELDGADIVLNIGDRICKAFGKKNLK